MNDAVIEREECIRCHDALTHYVFYEFILINARFFPFVKDLEVLSCFCGGQFLYGINPVWLSSAYRKYLVTSFFILPGYYHGIGFCIFAGVYCKLRKSFLLFRERMLGHYLSLIHISEPTRL